MPTNLNNCLTFVCVSVYKWSFSFVNVDFALKYPGLIATYDLPPYLIIRYTIIYRKHSAYDTYICLFQWNCPSPTSSSNPWLFCSSHVTHKYKRRHHSLSAISRSVNQVRLLRAIMFSRTLCPPLSNCSKEEIMLGTQEGHCGSGRT